jgi:hypothetical protein
MDCEIDLRFFRTDIPILHLLDALSDTILQGFIFAKSFFRQTYSTVQKLNSTY